MNCGLDFDQTWQEWPSFIFVQLCISRSQRLKIDFQDENFKMFLFETTRPRTLIFGM